MNVSTLDCAVKSIRADACTVATVPPKRSPRSILAERCRSLPRGSQRVLAELAGLSAETITRWKKGTGNPRLGELEAFALALKVSVVYLISDERQESPTYPIPAAAERRAERLVERAERASAAAAEAARELKRRR